MNFIKLDGKYINLDNIIKFEFRNDIFSLKNEDNRMYAIVFFENTNEERQIIVYAIGKVVLNEYRKKIFNKINLKDVKAVNALYNGEVYKTIYQFRQYSLV